MDTKKRLFVDMDGTLAEYRTFESDEQFYQKGYFTSLKPFQNVINAIRAIEKFEKDIDVYILSACYPQTNAQNEKNEWLDKYLPEIDEQHRIFTIVGQSKRDFIPGGIKSTDYLLDDYPVNLNDWAKTGKGIKLFNGLNATREKWLGSCISYKNSSSYIAHALTDVILKDKTIIDKMDEIQLKNEAKGQTLYISRDELTNLVNKYFREEYINLDDFRKHYKSSDWDFIKRLSPTARIETHTSIGQYKFEYPTLQRKIQNTLDVVVESLNNRRKEAIEGETELEIIHEKMKTVSQSDKVNLQQQAIKITNNAEKELNFWHTYFTITIRDINKMVNDFIARYKIASKSKEFIGIPVTKNGDELLSQVSIVEKVCNNIYNKEQEKIKELKTTSEIPNKHLNIGDDVLEEIL